MWGSFENAGARGLPLGRQAVIGDADTAPDRWAVLPLVWDDVAEEVDLRHDAKHRLLLGSWAVRFFWRETQVRSYTHIEFNNILETGHDDLRCLLSK